MARNELDAVVNLLASDQGLNRSIQAGLKGLEEMVKVAAQLKTQLAAASRALPQTLAVERIINRAAPNERAIVKVKRTAGTIVEANTIARNLQRTGSGNTPSQLLDGTIARREQALIGLTGRQRAASARQLSAAQELRTTLNEVNRLGVQADRNFARIVGPVSPKTQESYDNLKKTIGDIRDRISNNISRGRFTGSLPLVEQLRGKVLDLKALPGQERLLRQEAEAASKARSKATLEGIKRVEADAIADVKERRTQTKRGIARLESEAIEEAKEKRALNRRGIQRLEADQNADLKERDRLNKKGIKNLERISSQVQRGAAKASPEGRATHATQTRQRIDDNLFGDGGVNFAGRIAKSYGLFQAINAVYGAVFGTLGVLKDLDKELANLQGIAAATNPEMEKLAVSILDVASNSRFSVIELAEAATTLAQAGFSVNEIQDSLKSFALLATASGSTLAESVDVGTAALGSFQLRATDTAHVADVMSASLNLTKLTMEKLGLGLQYVGTTAYESNLSLEETVALLGGLANAGIRSGSTLGTGLRQLVVDLQDPTKKLLDVLERLGLTTADIDVKTNGLTGVMKNLADAGFSTADAFIGLETRAAATFLALRNQLPLVADLEKALLSQGAAAKAAEAQMGSLSAQGSQSLNNLAAIAIKMTAPLVGALTAALGAINDLLKGLNELNSYVFVGVGVVATGVATAALIGGLRSLIASYRLTRAATLELAAANRALAVEAQIASGALVGEAAAAARAGVASGAAAAQVTLLGRAFNALGGWWGIALGAAVALIPIMMEMADSSTTLANRQEDLQTKINEAKGKLDGYEATITSVEHEIDRLARRSRQLRDDKGALANEVARLSQQFTGLGTVLSGVALDYDKVNEALQSYLILSRRKREDQYAEQSRLSGQQIGLAQEKLAALAAEANKNANPFSKVTGGVFPSAAERQARDLLSGRTRVVEPGTVPRAGEISSLSLSDKIEELAKSLGENSPLVKKLGEFLTARATISSEQDAQKNRATFRTRDAVLTSEGASIVEDALTDIKANRSDESLPLPAAITALRKMLGGIDTDIQQELKRKGGANVGILSGQQQLRNEVNDYLQELLKPDPKEKEKKKPRDPNERYIRRASDSELKALEAEEKLPQTYDDFLARRDEMDAAVSKYAADRIQQAQDEIIANKLTGEKAQFAMAQGIADGENRGRQFWAKVGDAVSKGTKKVFDLQLQQIERQQREVTEQVRRNDAFLSGKLNGLDKSSLNGRAGDYNKQFIQDQKEALSELLVKSELVATIATIKAKQQEIQDTIRQSTDPNGAISTSAKDEIEQLKKDLDELIMKKAELEGFDSASLPLTFKESLNQAGSVWGKNNDAALSFSDTIKKNLGGAFESVSAAGTEFFRSIMSGSQSVLSAFSNFAQAMIAILEEMVAKFLATQLFNYILGAVGVSTAPAAAPGGPITQIYNGGLVGAQKPRYMMGGGQVANGSRFRDSVHTMLAKREFVTRGWAVDAVGADFMNDLNKRGPAAIRDRAGVMPVPTGGGGVVNVHIVLPEEKPQMGPNDVLQVVQRDMLDGGMTSKLVKTVALR